MGFEINCKNDLYVICMLYVCNKKLFVYRNCGLGVLFKIFSYETSIMGFKENFRKAKLVF